MSSTLWIPRATRERLAHPAAPGQRHHQIVKLAASLMAQGFNPEAVFHQIRPNYGADIPDSEIQSVIRWAARIPRRTDTPRFPLFGRNQTPISYFASKPTTKTPETAVKRFLAGFSCDEAELWEASPCRLLKAFEFDAETLISALYRPGEFINLVAEFGTSSGKAHPIGYGTTLTREDWLVRFRENGPPKSAAGVWIRPNPTDGRGISDINVAHFRFTLLEFDSIPLPLQLAFFARLPLPIAAVITSGGKSLHAWVKVDGANVENYRDLVSHIFRILQPFGIDLANRNPARLSRLPGVFRGIGGESDTRQRLLYLNPFPKTTPISHEF